MKDKRTLLIFFIIFYVANGFSQFELVPIKSGNTVLFGKDIVINELPMQDQRNLALCSSFNGWLYAGYTYFNDINHYPAITIMKSIDNGINWMLLVDMYQPFDNTEINSIDITVCGDSISNIKLFLAFVIVGKGSTTGIGDGYVLRFNGSTGTYEDQLHPTLSSVYSVSLSGDFMFPASNSNPYSLGCMYSYHCYPNNGDSIIFQSSSNGGISFDNRKGIAGTANRFGKVALTFGRGLSNSSGRYFAVWEEKDDYSSQNGHIYTAHSEPNFNSPFATPVMLDSINAAAFNNARNPVIACQYNNTDNDSSNITELVLFDKFVPSENRYDLVGLYNMKSTSTNNFNQFSLNLLSDKKQQASVCFNPFDSKFMVTYYDSTTQKLPFLLNNFNMTTPDNWQVVSSGYNESNALTSSSPKIAVNMNLHQAVMVWSKDGIGSKGVAMFDAPYNNWEGLPENDKTDNSQISVFPNPSSSSATMNFELNKREFVNISLFNMDGRYIKTIANQKYEIGKNEVKFDVSGLPHGTYFYTLKSSDISTFGKISVIR
ncbi:MAG: T9SS type A sorting domain-containing protein [Bacteroidales bacterium]|nr:T9SS type A sorting domain-containing protein [Bacteroidales bacterium]